MGPWVRDGGTKQNTHSFDVCYTSPNYMDFLITGYAETDAPFSIDSGVGSLYFTSFTRAFDLIYSASFKSNGSGYESIMGIFRIGSCSHIFITMTTDSKAILMKYTHRELRLVLSKLISAPGAIVKALIGSS